MNHCQPARKLACQLGIPVLGRNSRPVSEPIVSRTGRPEQLPFNVINQISLRTDSLATLRGPYGRLADAGATDIQPITHGNAISVYTRDQEGNRLEPFVDTPWYVSQPMRVPLDFAAPDDTLMRRI